MILGLAIPLFLIIIFLVFLLVILRNQLRILNKENKIMELTRFYFLSVSTQVAFSFSPVFMEEYPETEIHFTYLFFSTLIIFLIVSSPILNFRLRPDKRSRFVLAVIASLLSVNLSEFLLFSVFGPPFKAWLTYYSMAIMFLSLFISMLLWNKFVPKRKITVPYLIP